MSDSQRFTNFGVKAQSFRFGMFRKIGLLFAKAKQKVTLCWLKPSRPPIFLRHRPRVSDQSVVKKDLTFSLKCCMILVSVWKPACLA